MHIFRNDGHSTQFVGRHPAESGHLFTREQDIDPPARYGIMIALAISSGAFFVACIGLTIALCDWRMRYLQLRKYLDERGFALPDRTTTRHEASAEVPGGQEASEAGETRVSGAL
ncbi:hypothetical protein E4U42_004306 [Claviceps africana]|uniref:Uncharacterized protein n=1 Tax=Claviceps africana TaxID=83212 RepID=A0A8K0J5W2_9HYPO|nr:hypothetical protein E4U42_004306 [Claviceps africana]